VVDGAGKIVRETKVGRSRASPRRLVHCLAPPSSSLLRLVWKGGPLSQWLRAGVTAAGLPAVLIETRHVKAALKAMTVKPIATHAVWRS
jgi:transposase